MTQTAFVWTKEFREGFERFQRETGKEVKDLATEIMRVLVETLYHWTPPPTKGNVGSRGGREGGKAVVRQDISWVIQDAPQGFIDALYNRFGGGMIDNKKWRKKDGDVFLIDQVKVNPSGNIGEIDQWHKSMRKSRGRTLTFKGSTSEDIGRWRPRNKMLVPKGTREKYIRQVERRVGKLKSAWIPALRAVGSKLPPAWVEKANSYDGHYGTTSGEYDDTKIYPEKWSGYLEATAKAAYMRDSDQFVSRAHDYVQNVILGKRLDSWLDSMIKKHGTV